MTVLVRRVRAGELPPSLRGAMDPEIVVEVSVRNIPDESDRGDILDLIDRRQRFLRAHPELQEPDPVGRVRALRDEWD